MTRLEDMVGFLFHDQKRIFLLNIGIIKVCVVCDPFEGDMDKLSNVAVKYTQK